MAQGKTWDECKDDDQRTARIETRCAEYREYQVDETVDAGPAFHFADHAANVYLPWCLKELERLRKIAIKHEMLKNRVKNERRRRATEPAAAARGRGR